MSLRLIRIGLVSVAACAPSPRPVAPPNVHEASTLTTDGVRLHYRIVGEGPETVIAPFALYHGHTLDSLAVGRRVVTYDPRGRGRSAPVAPAQVSLDHLLLDLETVQQAVGAKQVALIGWSGAGMELFVYALRYPERVSRLVQLAPVGPRYIPWGDALMADRERRTDTTARAEFEARRRAGAFRGDPAAECRAAAMVTTPPLLADAATAATLPDVCVYPNEHLGPLSTYFGALFPTIRDRDWRDSLAAVAVPRLVVHGARDNMPLASSEEWVAGISTARLLVLANSGHFPLYEAREGTLAALRMFLEGAWPRQAHAVSR